MPYPDSAPVGRPNGFRLIRRPAHCSLSPSRASRLGGSIGRRSLGRRARPPKPIGLGESSGGHAHCPSGGHLLATLSWLAERSRPMMSSSAWNLGLAKRKSVHFRPRFDRRKLSPLVARLGAGRAPLVATLDCPFDWRHLLALSWPRRPVSFGDRWPSQAAQLKKCKAQSGQNVILTANNHETMPLQTNNNNNLHQQVPGPARWPASSRSARR